MILFIKLIVLVGIIAWTQREMLLESQFQAMTTTTRCRRQNLYSPDSADLQLRMHRRTQQESSLRTRRVHRPQQPVAQHRSRCDRQWIASTQQRHRCR